MAGESDSLLEFSWRGAPFPLTRISVSLAHDLVEHKYWGVDGARVEATGLAPLRISATIPISNHIVPAKTETWKAGQLYPKQLRWFVSSFARKESGILQHPEYGAITCKPERLDFELSGEKQLATEIHASWVETIDDDAADWKNSESPVQTILGAATDLAASNKDLKKLVPTLPQFREDIDTLARKLQAVGDVVSVVSYRGAGLVNNIIYRCNAIQRSVERAKDALTWPVIQNLNRIKAAAYDIREKMLSPGGIAMYKVPKDTTLAGAISDLPPGTSVADTIRLNPDLARGPVVLKGTLIRYRMKGT